MTPNEIKALDFIRERVVQVGFAPTLGEIGDHIGISGPGALRVVRSLAEAGHVIRAAGKSRGIDLPGYSDIRSVETALLRAELARRGEAIAPFAPRPPARRTKTVQCAVKKCPTSVRRPHVFCRHHWSLIPPGVSDALIQRHTLALESHSDGDRADYQRILDFICEQIASGVWGD